VTSAVPVSRSPRFAALAAAVSIALHGGGIALAARLEPRAVQAAPPLEVAFEVAEPPAAPPLPAPVPPAPAPRAMPALPPPSPAEPPPLPPPSEAPPPQAPAARPVPRVGISLSSTAVGGAFAVGVGNTLHGKASEIAADPAEVLTLTAGLALVVGALLIAAGVFRLGFLGDFLSKPVITGFLFGLGINIIVGQLPKVIGVPPTDGNSVQQFVGFLRSIPETNRYTLAIGLGAKLGRAPLA